MLKLYDYFRSSASFRVRIALNLKKLDYQDVPIHLVNNGGEQLLPAYQSINPQALIPTLQVNDQTITQSLAIIEYLDESHPAPALLPTDPYLRSYCRSIALSIAADMHPLNNLRVLKFLTQEFGLTEEKKTQWYQHWIATGLSALEKKISSTKLAGDFCLGNTPTMADICLAPQMYNARRFNCDISNYPMLKQIDANCQIHPAFIKAWPKNE